MKRITFQILLFLLSFTLLACVYVGMLKISVKVFLVILIILSLYVLAMGAGWKSMEGLKKYEQKAIHFGLTQKDNSKILACSLAALSPSYFCVILVSLVPLYTHEIWFITVFPCIFLNCLPASSVLEEYHGLTRNKLPFVSLFLLLTVTCSIVGMFLSSLFS